MATMMVMARGRPETSVTSRADSVELSGGWPLFLLAKARISVSSESLIVGPSTEAV